MQKLFSICACIFVPLFCQAQLVSNRAMNLFLSSKFGYYLSDYHDLSFYKNNITYNTAKGTFSLNHNLFQAKGNDEPVRSFMVVGASANLINASELGITCKQTWIAKPKTRFSEKQKQVMDAMHAYILHSLEKESANKTAEFEKNLGAVQPAMQATLREKFINDLEIEYAYKSASLQAETLDQTKNFDLITTSWTSISTCIPLLSRKFIVAESLTTTITDRYTYPLELAASHTRFWESRKSGRFFFTLYAGASFNSSGQAGTLQKITPSAYRLLGGTDTANLKSLPNDQLLLGSFNTFITPVARMQFIYFPPESHVGLELMAEQHFGSYNALNCTVGIPITLIDKKGIPAADFGFQLRFFDISHNIFSAHKLNNKVSMGLTVGIPFSKIIF